MLEDSKDLNSVLVDLLRFKNPFIPDFTFNEISRHDLSTLNSKEAFELAKTMPPLYLINLLSLCAYFARVTEYKKENRMDAYNISTCFGPLLIDRNM